MPQVLLQRFWQKNYKRIDWLLLLPVRKKAANVYYNYLYNFMMLPLDSVAFQTTTYLLTGRPLIDFAF